jgi:hexosaminidase
MAVKKVTTEKTPSVSKVGEKVKWEGAKISADIYSLDEGHEFEVILKEKPASNVIQFTLQTKGLDFFYTIDESMPDQYSNPFTQPFQLPDDVTILRVMSYRNGKPIGKLLNIPISSLKQRAVKVL